MSEAFFLLFAHNTYILWASQEWNWLMMHLGRIYTNKCLHRKKKMVSPAPRVYHFYWNRPIAERSLGCITCHSYNRRNWTIVERLIGCVTCHSYRNQPIPCRMPRRVTPGIDIDTSAYHVPKTSIDRNWPNLISYASGVTPPDIDIDAITYRVPMTSIRQGHPRSWAHTRMPCVTLYGIKCPITLSCSNDIYPMNITLALWHPPPKMPCMTLCNIKWPVVFHMPKIIIL